MGQHRKRKVYTASMNKFIHIYSGSSDLCEMDDQANNLARTSWLCSGCMKPRSMIERIDISVIKSTVANIPISAVRGGGTMVARQDFLDILPNRVQEQLYIGRLLDENGHAIPNFFLFAPKQKLPFAVQQMLHAESAVNVVGISIMPQVSVICAQSQRAICWSLGAICLVSCFLMQSSKR